MTGTSHSERSSYLHGADGSFGYFANVFANGDRVLGRFGPVYACLLQSCGLEIPRGKQSISGSVSTPVSWGLKTHNPVVVGSSPTRPTSQGDPVGSV